MAYRGQAHLRNVLREMTSPTRKPMQPSRLIRASASDIETLGRMCNELEKDLSSKLRRVQEARQVLRTVWVAKRKQSVKPNAANPSDAPRPAAFPLIQ